MEKDKNDIGSEEMSELTEEELLKEVKRLRKYLDDNLPETVNPENISTISKSALKAHIVRAALLHRADELTKTAFDLYQQRKLVPGLVIVRAAFETAALLYYVCKKLREAVQTKKGDNIDEMLMKVLFGQRRNGTEVQAINILTVIDHLDKETRIDGNGCVRYLYDELCEFAHPNWNGTAGCYARMDSASFLTAFDQEPKELVTQDAMLLPLNAALLIIEEYDKELKRILPEFTKLHEEVWKEQDSTNSGDATNSQFRGHRI